MRIGLTVSVLLHLSLLGWAVYSIQATEKFDAPKAPVIEAELVTVSEFTNLRKGDPDSKKLNAKVDEEEPEKQAKKKAEKAKPKLARAKPADQPPPAKEPPKPEPETVAEPPKPDPPNPEPEKAEVKPPEVTPRPAEPPPAEEPPPDPIAEKLAALPPAPAPTRPSAEERKKAAEELAKKREAERKKKLAEQKKREEKERERKRKLAEAKKLEEEKRRKEAEKSFDADRIAALLDKTPEKRGGSTANRNAPSEPTNERGPTAGERDGRGDQLTARERDLILSRIRQALEDCWRMPGAGGGVEIPVVVLGWQMRPDGTVDGSPRVVSSQGGTLSRQAEEAARRALYCVRRFDLPERYYNDWRRVEFAFDFRPTY